MSAWRQLASCSQLALRNALGNGQAFGWRALSAPPQVAGATAAARADSESFVGVVGPWAVQLEERDGAVWYLALGTAPTVKREAGGGGSPGGDSPGGVPGSLPACSLAVTPALAPLPAPLGTPTVKREPVLGSPPSDSPPSVSPPSVSPLGSPAGPSRLDTALRDYFQLDVDLGDLYAQWSAACPKVAAVAPHLPGMRILRQDPLECLVSFICSSNNNIVRITLMLAKLREAYGDAIAVESEAVRAAGVLRLFRFPTLAQLQRASEEELRALGFGYRAKYIVSTVSKLASREGARWLASLRAEPQSAEGDARVLAALLELDGVGPKVADCVALFSLDRRRVVPVDTHVWQIACRDFDRSLTEAKSLTPAVYLRVGELFRQRYGPFAGWAHSLLFAAELPQFRVLLPDATQHEMQLFSQLERGRKSELRAAKAQRKADKTGTAARAGQAGQAGEADEADEEVQTAGQRQQQPAKTDAKARKTGRAEPAAKAAPTAGKAASRTTARVDASSTRASKKRKAHDV